MFSFFLALLFALTGATPLLAQDREFTIVRVVIKCGESPKCQESQEKWQFLAGVYPHRKYLKQSIRALLLEGNVDNFSYRVVNGAKGATLFIDYQVRPLINDIVLNTNVDIGLSNVKKLLPLKEGEPFQENQIEHCENVIGNFLKDKGYHDYTIKKNFQVDPEKDEIDIIFEVNLGRPSRIGKLEIYSDNKKIKRIIQRRLQGFINSPFDTAKLKLEVDAIKKDLFISGHFDSSIDILNPKIKKETLETILRIKVVLGPQFMFTFTGQSVFDRQELKEIVHESVKANKNKFSLDLAQKKILESYEGQGLYNTKITLETREVKIKQGGKAKHIYFYIKEGKKVKVKSVQFSGEFFFNANRLDELYKTHSTVLAERGFYDKKFVMEDFVEILRSEYLKNGFVFAEIGEPQATFSQDKKTVEITFSLKEGAQCLLETVTIGGVQDQNLLQRILDSMSNRPHESVNPIALSEDLKKALKVVRNEGYFFATLRNKDSESLLQYSANYTRAHITLDFDLGEKVHLNNILITGNVKTRQEVILREIFLKKGEVITQDEVAKILGNLNSLGIFSSVKVDVLPDSIQRDRSNLLIQVNEKNSGLVELAPGYRSDIGMKLSLGVSYSNLNGMNRALGFRGQFNQRIHDKGLDARRRAEGKRKLEYSARVNFLEPYIFKFPLAFQASVDASRRRYFSFDANIVRSNVIFNKNLTRNFSTALKYQVESIAQEDATDINDNGYFRIGGLTPSLTWDLRDNRITSTKGAYFNISCEIANPTFLSQKKQDYEINFYKLVSRNKFYIPIKDQSLILALSLSVGLQENLADKDADKRSAIPRIKVFRLNGADLVRGYREEEINRLSSGRDISEVDVRSRAYFTNVKIEPRVYLNDETMLGYFFDAGGIYVDAFQPSKIRSSVGVSFKYLTPVGSLDFDYGIKLQRKRLADGSLERPGEFHISIGFF